MSKILENMIREVGALPENEQRRIERVLETEVRRAKRVENAPAGRWARLADRMEREAPMAGKSEKFLRRTRNFRDNFDMRIKSSSK